MPKKVSDYTIRPSRNGYTTQYTFQKKRYNVYGKTKAEVKRKLQARFEELNIVEDKNILNYERKSTTLLKDWLEEWLEDTVVAGKVKDATLAGYERYIRVHVKDELGEYQLRELTTHLFQNFLDNKMRKTVDVADLDDEFDEEEYAEKQAALEKENRGRVGAKTIHNIYNMLHVSLAQAVKEGYLLSNPIEDVELPEIEKREIRVLTKDEQARLISAAREHMNEKRPNISSFAVIFALFTGVRKGELLGLKWGDIDLEEGVVWIRRTIQRLPDIQKKQKKTKTILKLGTPKTENSNRMLRLMKRLREDMVEYRQKVETARRKAGFPPLQNNDFVFASRVFTPYEPRNFVRMYKMLLERAEIPPTSFHALRHTFATRALENEMDFKTLSVILGHSSPKTTMTIYMHVLPDFQQENMDKLDKIYA